MPGLAGYQFPFCPDNRLFVGSSQGKAKDLNTEMYNK